MLGTGLGDRFRVFRVCSERVRPLQTSWLESSNEQGKLDVNRDSESALSRREVSMVRRGSTVRVRQRALRKPRKAGFLLYGFLAYLPT
jgi:hypothetical protein